MSNPLSLPNPVIQASLEALLSRRGNRHDVGARTERLQAAALMECAEKGYSALNVGQIAARAKVSTASVYALYKDRDTLLVAALEMLFTIMADDVINIPTVSSPRLKVQELLIAHGQVYQQPLTLWLVRLYANIVSAGHYELQLTGLRVFQGIDSFWLSFFRQLATQGHLIDNDLEIAVPILLGAIERCTILSRLACGTDEPHRPDLETIARRATDILFSVWGAAPLNEDQNPLFTRLKIGEPSQLQAEIDRILSQASPRGPSAPSPPEMNIAPLPNNAPREAKQAHILRATIRVCKEHSYEGVGIKEISIAGRISTASVYKHFRDKRELITKAVAAEFSESIAFVSPSDDHGERDVAMTAFKIASENGNPECRWRNNIIMASELSGTTDIVRMARKQRDDSESLLASVVIAQNKNRQLDPSDMSIQLNFLLGGLERSSVLHLLLFDESTTDKAYLARLAVVATHIQAAYIN